MRLLKVKSHRVYQMVFILENYLKDTLEILLGSCISQSAPKPTN